VTQMLDQRSDRLTLDRRAGAPLVLAVGVGIAALLGLVVVDGNLKALLICLGIAFLTLGAIYPRLILYVVLGLVACLSQTTYGVHGQGVFRLGGYILNPVRLNLQEILIYALFGILVARRAAGREPLDVPRWVTVPIVLTSLVLLLQLARVLLGGVRYIDAWVPFNGQYILAGLVALWCFTELLAEAQQRLHALDFLYVCAAGRSIYALIRFFFGSGDTANAYLTSGVNKVALWESADHLLFVLLICTAIAAWATGRVSRGRLALWASGSVFMALTVALSYHRTSWIGLAVAIVLVSILLLRRSERSIALIPGVVVVLGAIYALSYSRFRTGGSLLTRLFPDVVSQVGSTRQAEWALAWQTIVHNPIAGELTARRSASSFAFWDTRVVHNAFLFAWMKLGLAGLLSLCFLGASCVVYAIRGVRSRGPEEYISLAVLGIVPFTLLLAMFETPLIELRTMVILAVAGALAVRVAGAPDGNARKRTGHASQRHTVDESE